METYLIILFVRADVLIERVSSLYVGILVSKPTKSDLLVYSSYMYIVSNSALLLLDGNNAFMESYLLFSTEYDGSCRDHILIAAHASFLHSLILLRDSSISWCLFQCQCTQTMLLINTWLTWVGIRFLISLSMYLIVMSPSRAEGFSAWLGSWPFFHSTRNRKSAKNKPKFWFRFLNNYFSKIGLKMIKLCT